ncbi:MFS transporter [Smaragdicoccus niigatensis]|uniref:MFS transporter n=1 Tax=Smaragdicoccus niigatensis TaxID=359359 RepID=UPI000B114B2D|nr:MFS transporter [Smaragdicoccus niigatensis]
MTQTLPEHPHTVDHHATGGHPRRWAILAVLVVSLLVVVLDNTVLNVALKTIQVDLDATQSQLEWAINSYTLVFAGLLFTWGILGDRFGRKRILMIGLTLFGIASAMCAYAYSPESLIAGRAFLGFAGAAVMPATLAIISNVFEPSERPKAIGLWAASVGIAVALGPITAGLLLQYFWWGSVFLINIPIVIIGLVAILRIVPESKNPNPGRMDPIGVLLQVGALVLITWAIIKGGELASITDEKVWVPGLAGLALLIAFVLFELKSDHPALDVRFFKNPKFAAANVTVGLSFFAMMGVFFFLTFYLQIVRDMSALETGLWMLPFAAAQLIAAPRSAKLAQTYGPRNVIMVGLTLVAISLVALTFATPTTPMYVLGIFFFLQGFGMGNVMPPATELIQGSVPREQAGTASAINNTIRQLGGALGVAVLGSVLSVAYRNEVNPLLDGLPAPAREAAGESLGGTLQVMAHAEPGRLAQVKPDVFNAYVDAMHLTAGLGAALTLASVVLLGFWLRTPYAPKHAVKEHVAQ